MPLQNQVIRKTPIPDGLLQTVARFTTKSGFETLETIFNSQQKEQFSPL